MAERLRVALSSRWKSDQPAHPWATDACL